ncbi:MAG: IS66 family transposase [Leptospiraceae bacterium]|nr:IS66 family transposase [Leptospiraceae bacterium]MCP5503252.1 IS66 family transposase [Leptospiraceae bacterium]
MKSTELPTGIKESHKIIQQQYEKLQEYSKIIKSLESLNKLKDEKIEYYRNQLYNKKSEKWTPEEQKQALLFNEAEQIVDEEKTILVKEHRKKKKKRGKRDGLDPNLPREEVILDLEEHEKVCGCGCMLTALAHSEVLEKLKIIPAQFVVVKTIRPQYVCKKCEGSGDENRPGVKSKPPVPQLIPKAILHRDSLAYMIVQKYCDHLPINRISNILKRLGVSISKATIARNFITIAEMLEPITNQILQLIQFAHAIQIDETRLQVVSEPGRKGTNLSWMWCFRSGLVGETERAVYFHYDQSRSAKFLKDFLFGYKGIIQTDGLGTYNAHLSSIVSEDEHAGCNVHARRKFTDIYKSIKNNKSVNHILEEYNRLYRLEESYYQLKIHHNKDKLEKRRQRHSLPIMERMKAFIASELSVMEPSGDLYKAMRYFISHYDKLIIFIYNGNITPDTNLVENAIRPFALGRKNWLFAFSPEGAKASAIYYALIENAKLCGLDPYQYLKTVFDEIVENPNFDPKDLTPQAIAKKQKEESRTTTT